MPDPPLAVYLDMAGLDVTRGHAVLDAAGIEPWTLADGADGGPDWSRVRALMVGYDRVDAGWFDRLPNLAVVATHSAGYDMVDVAEARRRGIWVTNVPAAAVDEVAVHALTLVLGALRDVVGYQAEARAGRWEGFGRPVPRTPFGRTVGVLGCGRIGQRFAALAAPMFGRVIGYDPGLPAAAWPTTIERCDSLTEFLAGSEIVSVHLPLTAQTAGLLDAEALGRLPHGAVLVNVSRGGLVDEAALAAALDSGQVSAAGLDVLAAEPPAPDTPLLQHPRVVVTPHVAYLSDESLLRYAEIPARNVIAWHRTGRPDNAVAVP